MPTPSRPPADPPRLLTFVVPGDDVWDEVHRITGSPGKAPMRHPDDPKYYASGVEITAVDGSMTEAKIEAAFAKPDPAPLAAWLAEHGDG